MNERIAVWHGHHNTLLSWVDPEERIAEIKKNKPEDEHELRLRLMKPVKGQLPSDLCEASRAYNKTWRAYDEAWQCNQSAIAALHNQECPDCPWDGETIFGGESQ